MGLIKVVIFSIIGLLIWRMLKIMKAKQSMAKAKNEKIAQNKMVKCQYCSVHLPQADALSYQSFWFCDKQHQQLFIDHKNK